MKMNAKLAWTFTCPRCARTTTAVVQQLRQVVGAILPPTMECPSCSDQPSSWSSPTPLTARDHVSDDFLSA